MKYIKLFEDIVSDGPLYVPDEDDIKQAIDDIFVDLEENGFNIYTRFTHYQRYDRHYDVEIQIDRFRNRPNKFDISTVKDRIEMTVDFIKDKWEDVDVKYRVIYVGDNSMHATSYSLDGLDGKDIDEIIITVEKVYKKDKDDKDDKMDKHTFIDKISKFFKRK